MDMQDKEIDQLFRSKLDDLEVEPSGRVWNGIASGMDKRKKSLKTYLSMAASLLLLLGAGLYLVSQTNNNIKKPVQIAVTKNNKPVKVIIQPVVKAPVLVQPKADEAVVKNAIKPLRKLRVKLQHNVLPEVAPVMVDAQPAQQLAQVQPVQKPAEAIKFTVPDRTVPFNEKIEITENAPFKSNTLAAQNIPAAKTMAAAPAKKHRIRSLGDLINVVVSKVDKRKDKLIEFSNPADEDDTVVSGLNLGFIKIKKEQ
ncbi:hypothetical protein [Mucilaginibacter phyllosphaerae]|uniref:Uncharacterized protein n=1 Tax=Mucilaginibacter phyllosphaerae TaxID=1812349 RepID=A0A4Y8A9F9_9SPHI|nr:hypothetical protein [Mucilaginibacter phyllosphaerae]MBB3969636.1 hypothetical protein [Mucilaginibacter phyllosphaerae]TEW65023.1 hypothetical protein E2R65_13980 [Mucilaginibacter phyllosphaerae]GGH18473.1 hypothetical protein GCM10007352_29210 [Mucilaginibacter phyllosphaerae]